MTGTNIPSKHIGAEPHFGRLFCDGAYGEPQYWIKQSDYEALRRRFEKACARVTELESAPETTPALDPGCIRQIADNLQEADEAELLEGLVCEAAISALREIASEIERSGPKTSLKLCPHCGKSEPHTHRVPGIAEPVVFPHD